MFFGYLAAIAFAVIGSPLSGFVFAAAIGALGAGMAGLVAASVAIVRAMLRARHRPVLILDGHGIRSTGRYSVSLPWGDIASVSVLDQEVGRLLKLTPRHATPSHASRRWWKFNMIGVDISFAKDSSDDILAAIRSHPLYRGKDSSNLFSGQPVISAK